MIERSLWHPVALSHAVGSQPQGASLLGEDLVLWRDAAGAAHAWADQCPHRGARLSLGRVAGGQLECPYHGWRFEGSGQCTHIPALPDFTPGARHRARSFDAREAYGMLWVRLAPPPPDAQPIHDFPLFAAESEPRLRKTTSGPYRVEASAPRIIENFLDMAHFGYVHEGWLGSRDRPEVGVLGAGHRGRDGDDHHVGLAEPGRVVGDVDPVARGGPYPFELGRVDVVAERAHVRGEGLRERVPDVAEPDHTDGEGRHVLANHCIVSFRPSLSVYAGA